ncbi:MAG TPA: LysR substrate-binding domain-containing protein [Streptosporangiaceae bacterium]|nr:LysR substrate-binding domain-containing protein [Streptosporangiaceae bacterium]
MLDVTRLRVLVAVARHGSVTAAARALNYAQPSVSHHLSRLEAETGALLTQRAGRGVRLTDAGRLLAERAEEILGRLDAAENELAAHVGLRAGRIRLAAFPSALSTIVPAAAARLEAENPGMDLTLAEAEPPEALRMLRAGYVDVALVFRHYQDGMTVNPPGDIDEGTRSRLLLDDPIHLVTRSATAGPDTGPAGAAHPPGWRPADEPPLPERPDLADYAGQRWIGGCERCRSYLVWQCELAGFTPKIAFTTDDFVAVQALVAAGLGITTLPGLALRAARHPGIQAAPLPGSHRHVLAVTYGEAPEPPAIARLLDVLSLTAGAERTDPSTRPPQLDQPQLDRPRLDRPPPARSTGPRPASKARGGGA